MLTFHKQSVIYYEIQWYVSVSKPPQIVGGGDLGTGSDSTLASVDSSVVVNCRLCMFMEGQIVSEFRFTTIGEAERDKAWDIDLYWKSLLPFSIGEKKHLQTEHFSQKIMLRSAQNIYVHIVCWEAVKPCVHVLWNMTMIWYPQTKNIVQRACELLFYLMCNTSVGLTASTHHSSQIHVHLSSIMLYSYRQRQA